jgi:phosphate/sulfate permease
VEQYIIFLVSSVFGTIAKTTFDDKPYDKEMFKHMIVGMLVSLVAWLILSYLKYPLEILIVGSLIGGAFSYQIMRMIPKWLESRVGKTKDKNK